MFDDQCAVIGIVDADLDLPRIYAGLETVAHPGAVYRLWVVLRLDIYYSVLH